MGSHHHWVAIHDPDKKLGHFQRNLSGKLKCFLTGISGATKDG
jgi:hypothetical protein